MKMTNNYACVHINYEYTTFNIYLVLFKLMWQKERQPGLAHILVYTRAH